MRLAKTLQIGGGLLYLFGIGSTGLLLSSDVSIPVLPVTHLTTFVFGILGVVLLLGGVWVDYRSIETV